MCEHCKVRKVTRKPLVEREGTVNCDLCEVGTEGSARFQVSVYRFQRHLCGAHTKELRGDLREGMAEVWKNMGLQEETDFVAIRGDARCDFQDPEEARKVDGAACGKPAHYAEMGLVVQPMCPDHARVSEEAW